MITVKLNVSNQALAQEFYNRNKDWEVLKIVIGKVGVTIEQEISVGEAEDLAKQLLEWAHEIKPYDSVKER